MAGEQRHRGNTGAGPPPRSAVRAWQPPAEASAGAGLPPVRGPVQAGVPPLGDSFGPGLPAPDRATLTGIFPSGPPHDGQMGGGYHPPGQRRWQGYPR